MDYICDICGTTIVKTEGYAYNTTQVVTSKGYWAAFFERDAKTYGFDGGSMVAMAAQMMSVHDTPWIVCSQCSPLVDADAGPARRYAAQELKPPGCGRASQEAASIAAAYAWSHVYGEWPTSIQVGSNPVTHDPGKGRRCDFCRRIVYGEEKFGMFAPQMYRDLVARGATFERDPPPTSVVNGEPYFIACMTCLDRAGVSGAGDKTASKRPWWKFW